MGDSCSSMHLHFGPGNSDATSCFSQAIDRLDFSQEGLPMLFGRGSDESACMRTVLGNQSGAVQNESRASHISNVAESSFVAVGGALQNQCSTSVPLRMLHNAGSLEEGPHSMLGRSNSDLNHSMLGLSSSDLNHSMLGVSSSDLNGDASQVIFAP